MEVPKFPSVRYTHSRPTGFAVDEPNDDMVAVDWVTVRTFVTNDEGFALRVFNRDRAIHGDDICQTREAVMSGWGPER